MVRQSYEGIESPLIRISGGDINLTASNDGLNVAGTGDGRKNWNANNHRQAMPDRRLYISGGTIRIDSGSDGIDINGSGEMSGGEIYVAASPSGYIGALDYDRSFTISGGILVAAGSSTMSQMPLETSSQPSIMIYYNRDQSAGREVTIKDAQGRQVFAYTPPKAFRSIVISTPALHKGAAYTVSTGNGVTTDINLTGMALVVSEDGQAVNQGRGSFGPPRR
jgi:hypothetical protein